MKEWKSEDMAYVAFPAEMKRETQDEQEPEREYFDSIENEEDEAYKKEAETEADTE